MRDRGALRPIARLVAICAAAASLGATCNPPLPAWDLELLFLGNRSFESGILAPWILDQGGCEVEYGPGFAFANAVSGDYLFYGGDTGTIGDCRIHQDLDLQAFHFQPQQIDQGIVDLDASAWMRSRHDAGSFDDQVFYRVRFLNAYGGELGSVRTLIAGDDAWLQRRATGVLPPGTRHLRVEIEARHRDGFENDGAADLTSVMLHKTTRSAETPPPVITKQPVLQGVTQTGITVLWETNGNPAPRAVRYGLVGQGLTEVEKRVETTQVDASHFVHKAVLSDLEPETEYLYQVETGRETGGVFEFRTAPFYDTPFRVAWFADNQNGPSVLQQLVVDMAARDPDLAVVPGDIVQNGDDLPQWYNEWFGPLELSFFSQTTPMMIARGNHDAEHAFSYAYTAVPGNEAWYAFEYGNAFFVVLDTEAPTGSPILEHNQADFMVEALTSPEALAAEFRIVTFHKPPYTNLWDATNVFACLIGGEYDGEDAVRSDWVPLFEQYDVDLVVSGHTHSYQHGVRNGVHYVMVGGAGGALDTTRGCFGSTFWSFIATEESQHHYNLMDVDGESLTWTAYDQQDAVLHSFQIVH